MVWEVLGAVIGAGFASGQELAAFFARFGGWSWLGVAAAALCVGLLLARVLRLGTETFHRRSWQATFLVLALAAGGAMIAAAGELAALCLPIHGARWLGMALMLAAGMAGARRQSQMLAIISRVLTMALLGMLLMCLTLPGQRAARVEPAASAPETAFSALLHGICYGGFNLALAAPMAAEEAAGMSGQARRQAALRLGLVLGVMVSLGNLLLLRHPLQLHAALPLVQLTAAFGKAGFYGCCAVMLLAVLTTLIAALRDLAALLPPRWQPLGAPAAAAMALFGFSGIVSRVYPLLGGLCAAMLLLPAGAMKAEGKSGLRRHGRSSSA